MKPSQPPRRTPSNLSNFVHHQLNMYALAASAAGVGLLGLAHPADARIIYTPANQNIAGIFPLDLNHDGTPDFYFFHNSNAHFTESVSIRPNVSKNDMWGTQGNLASALLAGIRIGPSKHFSQGHGGSFGDGKLLWRIQVCGTQTPTCKTNTTGQWKPPITNHFLGLKFIINGKKHYGWARVSYVNAIATLTGYAYETIPGKPIVTGKRHDADNSRVQQANTASGGTSEPAGLGRLAQGASGLHAWRREEQLTSVQ